MVIETVGMDVGRCMSLSLAGKWGYSLTMNVCVGECGI